MPEDTNQLTWPAKVSSPFGDYTVRGQEVFPLKGKAVFSLAEDGSSAHLRAEYDPSGSGALALAITLVGAAASWHYVIGPYFARYPDAGALLLLVIPGLLALSTCAACILTILIRLVRRCQVTIDLSRTETIVVGPSLQRVKRWALSGANTIIIDPNTHRMAFQANRLGVPRWVAFELKEGFHDVYARLKATAPANIAEAEIRGPGLLRKASVYVLLAVSAAGLAWPAVFGLWFLAHMAWEALMRWWAH